MNGTPFRLGTFARPGGGAFAAIVLGDDAVGFFNGLEIGGDGPVLVCCALGYSRSAVAAAAWLIAAGHATDTEDALAQVRRARPQVVVGPKFKLCLEQWTEQRNEHAG